MSSCDVSATAKSSLPAGSLLARLADKCETMTCVVLETRLLNAGQPLQPSAPPVPLQCPPPGHEPEGIWFAGTYVDLPFCTEPSAAVGDRLLWWSAASISEPGAETDVDEGRLRFVGREVLRAFKYSPHALQMVEPVGDRRQSGVLVVSQLLEGISSSGALDPPSSARNLDTLPAHLT